MNKWLLMGGLAMAAQLDAACDSPLPTQPTTSGSTGGGAAAGYTGGKATAVLEDAGGGAAVPEGGVVPLPDGSVDATSACLAEPLVLDVNCRSPLLQPDGGVIDVGLVEVYYRAGDDALYLVVANQVSDCQLGWHFTDNTDTEIEICGSTCDRIKSDPNGQVWLYAGCQPIMFP